MKRLFLALSAALLAGCAAPESRFDKLMAGFIGKPADAVMMKYGMPHRTRAAADGSQTLIWEDKHQFQGLHSTHYMECVFSVKVDPGGTVAGYERRGNGCKN